MAAIQQPEEHVPRALPAGTVTFLLTDTEGSTRRWEAPAMAEAVARHYDILDAAVTGHGGVRPARSGLAPPPPSMARLAGFRRDL